MTKLTNILVVIGWIIDELNKMQGFSSPSMVISDYTRQLEPGDYCLIHQKFPPLLVNDLVHLQPQVINAIFTDNIEQLWNFTREEGFFKHRSSYIFVTAIDQTQIEGVFTEIFRKFRISRLFAINDRNGEVLFYDGAFRSAVVHTADKLVIPMNRRMSNFAGHPFKVVYFYRDESFLVDGGMNIIGGQDGIVMKTMAEQFNATLLLVETSDGKRYGQAGPNGTIQGAFTNLLQGTADITGNTHFMKSYGTGGLSFTHYLSSDRLCLLVPKPKKIPNYQALYSKVQYRWFYLYAASCIFGLMTVRKVETLLLIGASGMSANVMISVVFKIFFGVPMGHRFNKLHEKLIICSFLMATVVISNYFQCMMTTIASSPSYEKTMSTLADVRDRRVPIFYSNKDVKSYLNNEDLRGLNFIEVSVEESIAAANRNGTGRTHRTYSVFTKKNMYYKGLKATRSMLIVPDCLVDYPLAFVVPEGYPILEQVNWVLSKLVESGLYLKWTKDSVPPNTYVKKTRKEASQQDTVKNYELYYAYALWGMGLSISSVVFVAEKIVHQKTLKTRTDDQMNSRNFGFIS